MTNDEVNAQQSRLEFVNRHAKTQFIIRPYETMAQESERCRRKDNGEKAVPVYTNVRLIQGGRDGTVILQTDSAEELADVIGMIRMEIVRRILTW